MLEQRVFVCGCGHSGTTLVLTILASHSKCHGIPYETDMFLDGNINMRKLAHFEQEAIQQKKTILVEKTPRHVYHIAKILGIIHSSKIIVCIRNPLDVIGSLQKRFLGNIHESVIRYIEDNKAHFPFMNNKRVYFLKYENLVTDTEKVLVSVCEFLGISYEESMLFFHKSDVNWGKNTEAKLTDGRSGINHRLLRNYQVHQPISDKRGEWRKIIPTLGRPRITSEEYKLVKQKTLSIANILGYTYQEPYMLQTNDDEHSQENGND